MPPRHTAHNAKTAAASRKSAARQLLSSPPSSLSGQVRELELAHATLTEQSSTRDRHIEDLTAKLEQLRATNAANKAQRIRRNALLLGDYQRALHEKAALMARLATGRRVRDALRAQLTHDALESRIHRSAAQVAYKVFESKEQRDTLLTILKRCRTAFTGSEAPPGLRPPSPELDSEPEQENVEDEGGYEGEDGEENDTQQQAEVARTPKREQQSPLTPVSIPRMEELDDIILDSSDLEMTGRRSPRLRLKKRRIVLDDGWW